MLFFPVVNEACRILDEGISVKFPDLDIASIMGMGFPSYRLLFIKTPSSFVNLQLLPLEKLIPMLLIPITDIMFFFFFYIY